MAKGFNLTLGTFFDYVAAGFLLPRNGVRAAIHFSAPLHNVSRTRERPVLHRNHLGHRFVLGDSCFVLLGIPV